MTKYTNLQVGRIIAAALVLVYHAAFYGHFDLGVSNPLAGGESAYWFRTTVVFLFALSGFVLAHCLQKTSLDTFLKHRLLRLFPAFWVSVVLVLAITSAVRFPPIDRRSLRIVLTLWPSGRNRPEVLLVDWTLVYELFLSLAIIPLAALGRRRGLGLGVALWLGLCLGNQFLTPGQPIPWNPRLVEMPLSLVNIPFLLGILVYLVHQGCGRWRWGILLTALAGLYGGARYCMTSEAIAYLLQSAGSALLVGFLATSKQLPATNPLVIAGDWSYGLYLIHVSILRGMYGLIGLSGWITPSFAVVIVCSVLALTFGTAYGMLECAGSRRLRAVLTRKPRELAIAPLSRAA